MSDEGIIVNSKGGKQHKVDGRFDLIPAAALTRVAIVLEEGAERYGENNWQKIDAEVHINHAIAHLYKFLSGDKFEDHLTNGICRLLFASHMIYDLQFLDSTKAPGMTDLMVPPETIDAYLDESDPGTPANFMGGCRPNISKDDTDIPF